MSRRHIGLAGAALAIVLLVTWMLLGNMRADAASALSGEVRNGTLFVRGSAGNDQIALRLAPANPAVVQVDFGNDGSAELSFDRSTFDAIDVDAAGGADLVRIDQSGGVFTDTESTTLRGGGGNDTLFGGAGAETLDGGGGNDVVDGNLGMDLVRLGGGADTAVWDPGDASDTIEGSSGKDTLLFNGSNVAEAFELVPNGSRVELFRNVGNVVMDLNEVETVDLRALGGADVVNVHDLGGTAVRTVNTNLEASGGGGDGAADQVIVAGTVQPDALEVTGVGGAATVKGLTATPVVTGGEPALDQLIVNSSTGNDLVKVSPSVGTHMRAVIDGGSELDTVYTDGTGGADTFTVTANGAFARIDDLGAGGFYEVLGADVVRLNGLGGADTMTAVGNLAALIGQMVFDGGGGNDTLLGGNGNDLLLGGAGNDFVDGQQGNDTALLGSGKDVFQWDPGDGSDVVEGQDSTDTLLFNGSNTAEAIDVSANGSRVRLTRNIGNIVMDVDGVETVDVKALGSADVVSINDLAGTATKTVAVDLAGLGGVGDGAADSVVFNGTAGNDVLQVSGSPAGATVTGMAAVPLVTGGEPTLDSLVVSTLGGNDSIKASPSVGPFIRAVVDGGADTDTVFTDGTSGADTFSVTANGAFARIDDVAAGGFYEVLAPETLRLNGAGGSDTMTAVGNLAALIGQMVFDGGAGNDTLLGGNGNDLLLAGEGNDFVDGQQGNDTALLGGGNDVFQWDPGDGNDTVEGQAGADQLLFNGSNAAEIIDVTANGSRVRVARNIASIVTDVEGVEAIRVNAAGSADVVNVGELTGTATRDVVVDLGLFGAGDLQPDTVTVTGTNGVDNIAVSGSGTTATVTGLWARVQVLGAEFANDSLRIETLAGADTVNSSSLAPGVIQLFVDGVGV